MKDYHANDYLLGAGSKAGEDTHFKEGIAYGHAYCIVNICEARGERLIQMQNPWGKGW